MLPRSIHELCLPDVAIVVVLPAAEAVPGGEGAGVGHIHVERAVPVQIDELEPGIRLVDARRRAEVFRPEDAPVC